jgi:hypothetical protein
VGISSLPPPAAGKRLHDAATVLGDAVSCTVVTLSDNSVDAGSQGGGTAHAAGGGTGHWPLPEVSFRGRNHFVGTKGWSGYKKPTGRSLEASAKQGRVVHADGYISV